MSSTTAGGELERRVARAVAIAATVGFALAATWELFGPLLAGHYASSASMGIIAENMLRWHIPGPVWEYTRTAPTPQAYYCHHPWGIFWTTALLMKVFGRHDFVCRLAPVLLSTATPALLYDLGRRIWRPASGAAAAVAFVVLPIALAFANFNALEVPVIAWSLVFLWGFVRLQATAARRHLAVCLVGLTLMLNADWPAFVLAGELLAFVFARALLLRRVFGPLLPRSGGVSVSLSRRERTLTAFWMSSVAITLGTLALYVWLFAKSHKLGDLAGSGELRSSGNQASLASVLFARRYWIELCFTPIAILLGKVGAVVCALRLVGLRREQEVIPLLVLGMAVFQYVVFKQGADVHVFWPHYFAEYFALSMGALTATTAALLERAGPYARRLFGAASIGVDRAGVVALGASILPLLFVARDGLPALRYARGTGGRFNEKGLFIESDGARTAALAWFGETLPRAATIGLHDSMRPTWAQVWTLGGRVVSVNRPPPHGRGPDDLWVADSRFLADDVQADLAAHARIVAVGSVWSVSPSRATEPPGFDAFVFDEREPSLPTWYFVSGTEPVREVRRDAYAAWELATHFGLAAEVPAEPPRNLEQLRIAHNIAIAAGDSARAATLLASLGVELGSREHPLASARYDDGTEIVGASFSNGVAPTLTLYVRAGPASDKELAVLVRSRVLSPARLSTTMADPAEREIGAPLPIAPSRWRPGFVYSDPVVVRKRPGHEVFRALLAVRGRRQSPKRVDAKGDLVVLDLP